MQASSSFLKFLSTWEGVKLCPYKDVKGIPTIGIGNTFYKNGTKVKMSDRCLSMEEVSELAQVILKDFEEQLSSICPNVNQNQFDALLSFSYNVGIPAFKNSTLLKRVKNNAKEKDIREAFNMWTKVRNPKTKILEVNSWQVKRRKAEADLYLKPTN